MEARLLVTDVVLPGLNGRELWERLEKLRPGLRVLYISGYTDDAIAERAGLDPGVEILCKPFSADVLLRTVRAILDCELDAAAGRPARLADAPAAPRGDSSPLSLIFPRDPSLLRGGSRPGEGDRCM